MHTDPELLSLFALGEEVGTDEDRFHVQTCRTCAEEISELQQLVTLARDVGPDTGLTVPSPRVWARIREGLGLPQKLELVHPLPSRGSSALVAHATLAAVRAGGSPSSGEAVIAIDELGRQILQVAVDAELPSSGVRRAWLVHRTDETRKQALGLLDGPYGVWTVDRSIDLELYGILDISQQGAGDTEHSGHTIVRGELTLVG